MSDPNSEPGDERRRRQATRSRLMAVLLGLLVVLLFAITIAKIGLASHAAHP